MRFTMIPGVPALALLFAVGLPVTAQVPQLISYQGQVSAHGTAFDGDGHFKFALVNGNGTQTFWSNDGSSIGGGEPGTSVALQVSKGLFTVLLGDATLAHMTIIPATVFANSDVRLRVWFTDGSTAFQQLSPDQRIAAVGYALMAQSVADGAITSAKLAPGAVTSDKLAAGAVTADKLGNESITSSRLAPFAAAQNLALAGQSAVASGGIILAEDADSASLANAGYVRIGTAEIIRETWQVRSGPSPSPRTGHTAVWTGNEMIVWGGYDGVSTYLNDGGVYNPAANTWSQMAPATQLVGRRLHTAVWTGTQMIVWGGRALSGQNIVNLGDGATYDPVGNVWNYLSYTNGTPPSALFGHTAVWTGTEMILWGGYFVADGARYNPSTLSWLPISTDNAPSGRYKHCAVWTGTEMIIWGGLANDAARYHPGSNTWAAIPVLAGPASLAESAAVWTGKEMIVWGGDRFVSASDPSARFDPDSNGFVADLNTGGRFDPASNRWVITRVAGAPSARSGHTAVWTGTEMLVWGGFGGSDLLDDGAAYHPETNGWSSLSEVRQPGPRGRHTAVWTGAEMIVWGGNAATNVGWNDGARYDPVNDRWISTAVGGFPARRVANTAVWTGTEMILWGGGAEGPQTFPRTGVRYNPATDLWSSTSTHHAPDGRLYHTAVWTGKEMIVWGGQLDGGYAANDGGRYDPITDSWFPTDIVSAPSPRQSHTAVWTGQEMIVFGGSVFSGPPIYLDDGARYDPAVDLWMPLSKVGAPAGRKAHTVVWTGTEMIVWGGVTTNANLLSSGGRYDPSADQWTSTNPTNTPPSRSGHTAVWTGTEMIVWGGGAPTGPFNGGSRYDPVWDLWRPVTFSGAPVGRNYGNHTAVWTGREMIIWGGGTDAGRYFPTSNSWLPISLTGAPSPTMTLHSAVWTGSEMLVSGGSEAKGTWRYVPPRDLYVFLRP